MELHIKKHMHDGKHYIDVVSGARVQFKDYFNAKELMQMMRDWFSDNGWASRSDKDFPERFYHHQFLQGGLQHVRWRWRLYRYPPEAAGSNFFQYEFFVDVRIIGLKNTEVMKRGMKFSTHTGDIEISIEGRLILDSGGEWRQHFFLKHFYDLYVKRIGYKEVLRQKAYLRRDVYRFRDALKAFFKLPATSPEEEGEGQFQLTKDFD